ncbi:MULTISPECIES: carboxymuconolactone decarboxylase family protein [Burkholderia]|uniref:carboxymuconolactone decarboxylase family protein n=1 Tax=Burkholderia TaxID=32008 RepID=UPI000BF1C524|nr:MULTISPECIES: carboxymuconolactone decarboxylase family protein [Burkholderia]MBJ9664962.1 carboxymuconolactone decarboxylase family protein [Burkholderia gladioli]MBU9168130.1 carboxymuconolactone decarboxylase family protein [Burkholderia gladioli]MBU9213092.1 carboxymuconolactone decarboxylase family protein [Burkholderia gladioli]MBU9382856.1 carboxymuconolactone decarboxylase family protein [Burkholderia gladioli]MDN7722325.1 carboxymuconolactone decarboxylase family protein [Burkholde
MARLPLHTVDTAPEASRPFLEKALAANGYLPNLVASLANAPAALETYLTVAGINGRSGLSLAERETVQITAAAIHGCGFCVAGHTAVALKKAQLPGEVVDAIRDQSTIADTRLAAVADFTRAVIATRGAVADDALAAFHTAGFDDANALEVILGVSLATLCNFANNFARNELNPQLEAYRWEPKARAA